MLEASVPTAALNQTWTHACLFKKITNLELDAFAVVSIESTKPNDITTESNIQIESSTLNVVSPFLLPP